VFYLAVNSHSYVQGKNINSKYLKTKFSRKYLD